MLKVLLICVSALLFAQSLAAQGRFPSLDSDSTWSMRFTFSYDGKIYTNQLDSKRLETSPEWDLGKTDPPLTPTRAAAVAKEHLTKLIKIPFRWDVQSIELVRAFEKNWFYSVKFGCVWPGCKTTGSFNILVKMNGSAVDPTVEKEK